MSDSPEDRPLDENEAGHHFYRLLGEFHHSYTALEHELSCVVFIAVTQLKSPLDEAMIAMLGGQRMSPLKDTIKHLLRVTKADQAHVDFAGSVFSQLGEIQFFRNRLTHYLTVISDYNPECWINMNFTGIRERDKMEDLHFNLYALYAAASDLQIMRTAIGPLFNYRIEGSDTALKPLPSWLFDPAMLVRNYPE